MEIDKQYLPEDWPNPEPKDPTSQAKKKEESEDELPHVKGFDYIDRTTENIGGAVKKLTTWTDSDCSEFHEWADREEKKITIDKQFLSAYGGNNLAAFVAIMEEKLNLNLDDSNVINFDKDLFEKMKIDPNRMESFNLQLVDIIYDIFYNFCIKTNDLEYNQYLNEMREKIQKSTVYDIFITFKNNQPEWAGHMSCRGLLRLFEQICDRNGFIDTADKWKRDYSNIDNLFSEKSSEPTNNHKIKAINSKYDQMIKPIEGMLNELMKMEKK